MHERMIMDGAGDLWTVEAARPAGAGTTMVRCRHEMGYELMITLEDVTPRLDHERDLTNDPSACVHARFYLALQLAELFAVLDTAAE